MSHGTSLFRCGRLGGIAMVALAAACAGDVAGDAPVPAAAATSDVDEVSQLLSGRRTCGTKSLSDAETTADASRVAEFKRRGRTARTGITIRTYVHVIHDGAEGLVSGRTIRDQIRVLNEAYAPYGFQFEMAASVSGNPNPDFSDNAAWFAGDELAYKTALKEGSGDDLNIYTTAGEGYLGYAYYPNIVGSADEVLDGLVLAYGTLPGAFQPGISDIPGFVYNLGDTATHEVGHYLGLAHTFDGHCSSYNDGVSDTPAERSADFYCTEGRNTCPDGNGAALLDPIHNFMDYSDDVCLDEFTAGQSERMAIQWALYRQGH